MSTFSNQTNASEKTVATDDAALSQTSQGTHSTSPTNLSVQLLNNHIR